MSNSSRPASFDSTLFTSPRVRLATLALGAASLLVVVATIRAATIDTPTAVARPAPSLASAQSLRGRVVQIDPAQVVATDIFAVDRSAPSARYPMPGEFRENRNAEPTEPLVRPRVLGTAVGNNGEAFATAQNGGPPRIIRVGDKLGIYTVVAITRGTVTFRAADAAPFQINAP